jgi:hypothetical protein
VLFVLSLYAGKEWLLDYEVGVFWVVMRVLACGGLGVLVWEGMTKQLGKRKSMQNIEVRQLPFCPSPRCFMMSCMCTVASARDCISPFVHAASVPLHGIVSPVFDKVWHSFSHFVYIVTRSFRVILFTHFSTLWVTSVVSPSSVREQFLFWSNQFKLRSRRRKC